MDTKDKNRTGFGNALFYLFLFSQLSGVLYRKRWKLPELIPNETLYLLLTVVCVVCAVVTLFLSVLYLKKIDGDKSNEKRLLVFVILFNAVNLW